MPPIKDLPEGKSPAGDESRTAEPITLDAFFKTFKESTEKQDQRFKEQDLKMNQRFNELITRMDVIDQRYKDQDRCFQEQDQRFEHLEQPFQRREETSVEMKEDLGRNCKQEACLVSKRVPKVRTHTARSPVSQRTTLPQMGGKVLPRLENLKKSQIWFNEHA